MDVAAETWLSAEDTTDCQCRAHFQSSWPYSGTTTTWKLRDRHFTKWLKGVLGAEFHTIRTHIYRGGVLGTRSFNSETQWTPGTVEVKYIRNKFSVYFFFIVLKST